MKCHKKRARITALNQRQFRRSGIDRDKWEEVEEEGSWMNVRRRQKPVAMNSVSIGKMDNFYWRLLLFGFGFGLALVRIPASAALPSENVNDLVLTSSAEMLTTTEFDYSRRGNKKFGDKCEITDDCGFPDSVCDAKKKSCQCVSEYPITNHIDKCGKEAAINESCFFNEQCEAISFQTECRDHKCICRFEMTPTLNKDGSIECKSKSEPLPDLTYVDPAMIIILVAMALMFIIICVVLRLFSKARWRDNRTIFNTPNPRLMNVSLLRENKLLHGQERRGSRVSVRIPSRQPSMASLRPHSPNPSLGSRRGSRGSSNASATSTKSNRSATNVVVPINTNPNSMQQHLQQHHQQHATNGHNHHPGHNNNEQDVTVEIADATK